jgi:predicted AlkP superfamily phosphohydrolase/phosphomutase
MALSTRPVVVFGIDGATHTLLDPFLSQGKLPNLSRLRQEGACGTLRSTIHPLTPAAWVSMVTGLNPGKHGVYDFRRRKASGYDWEFVNSQSWHGEPVWSILGSLGRKVGVFNVPMTYPPQPVNGFMVSGMGTPPGSRNFIYPSRLADRFKGRFPDYAVEPDAVTGDLVEYLQRLERSLDQRMEALRFLWRENADLDFFMPVFIETDRLHHVFWRFLDPAMADYHDPSAGLWRERVAALYQKIDGVLGELWAWAGERRGYIVVVSDHGFGPLLKDVYMNKWLVDCGYLRLKSRAGAPDRASFFAQVDWSKSRAYSFGFFGNINLNLHGREPQGIVEPGRDAEDLKAELTARLLELADPETGEAIVDAVYRKEELYSGLHLDQAPDVLVVMRDYAYMTRDGYDFNSGQLVGPPMRYNPNILAHSGNHRLEGILFMAGEGVRPGFNLQGAAITDVAPTLLYLAGAPVPAGLDGQVLWDAFEEGFVAAHPVTYTAADDGIGGQHKPVRLQLLEKDVRISLLQDEVQQLRQVVVDQRKTIEDLQDVIRRFQGGRIMRFLAWLHRIRSAKS